MSVQELESAVSHLALEEFAADVWDRQIEADARAGKLDHLISQADAEFEAGRCTPL